MSATVDILTNTRYDVITVPVQAVTTRVVEVKGNSDQQGASSLSRQDERNEVLFRIDNGRARQVTVKTGIQDRNFIEILEGIESGDEIVTGPFNAVSRTLTDSMLVKIVTEDELFKKVK
jgi:HlyD family secretion protein